MPKNKILFTDFFGVFVDDLTIRYLTENNAMAFKDNISSPADLGEIDFIGVCKSIGNLLNKDFNEVRKALTRDLNFDINIANQYRSLKKDYLIVLISNAPKGMVEEIIKFYRIDDIFDSLIISSEVKLIKPYKEIYELAISKYNKNHETMFMVDDNYKNLKVLPGLGIKGILYKKGINLKEELEK